MDKQGRDNRANQLNPNNLVTGPVKEVGHQKVMDNRADQLNQNNMGTGPGREAGYQGKGDKADLKNHGEQLNPNNPKYKK